MSESYQIADAKETGRLAEFLSQQGKALQPFVDLIEGCRLAVDELVDLMGRATIQAVLTLSAQGVAGPKHPGKPAGDVYWYGTQEGTVPLRERRVRVRKPRLRRKGEGVNGEVPIPAYEAMNLNEQIGERMREILLAGVSTRNYARVIPDMAETVGVSKSQVSRAFVEASEAELRALAERRFDEVDLLVIYLDGVVFGDHHAIVALGVDAEGKKHVLGLAEGATENATVVTGLLENLVERGVKPGRRRLFVIDGSKALRKAIDAVYGQDNPVQRCRNHKVRNVVDHLPKELRPQAQAVLKAAYRLEPKEGMARIRKQAEWLAVEYPSAAESLLEGLEETFTVNRLGLAPSLRRCLCTTNAIENPHSGVRRRTGRVSRWRGGSMVLRWVAGALLETEKGFRRIMGHSDLWILKAVLDGKEKTALDRKESAG